MTARTKVFVSYSRKDKRWLEELKPFLNTLNLDSGIDYWDDTKIKSGASWRSEIDAALASARIAVLLVSENFLSSEFIRDNEMPPLINAADAEGAVILPLVVRPCSIERNPVLSRFQTQNPNNKALSQFPRSANRDEIYLRLAGRIKEILAAPSQPSTVAPSTVGPSLAPAATITISRPDQASHSKSNVSVANDIPSNKKQPTLGQLHGLADLKLDARVDLAHAIGAQGDDLILTTQQLQQRLNDYNKSIKLANDVLSGMQQLKFNELQGLADDLKEAGQNDLAQRIRRQADDLKTADERKAIKILSGEKSTPAEMFKLAKALAEYKQFGYARRLLDIVRGRINRTEHSGIYLRIFQKCALYTYKDPDLPLAWRLDRALLILKEAEDLATTTNQETLGITGGIYKRKWEMDGHRQHLELSLFYYLKGYAQGSIPETRADILGYLRKTAHPTLNATGDQGYNGINAAFILDLLVFRENEEARKVGLPSVVSNKRQDDARLIRQEIVRSVPPLPSQAGSEWLKKEWWFYATVGEAYFGLEDYGKALEWFVTRPAAAGLRVPEWERESTAQQLTRLALMKCDPDISEEAFELTESGKALKAFLRSDAKKVRSAFRGKFGLALSGGGFRASLYHIGVLAKLAELDVLRHVEVLSCVSGGSIIGAYYYLELRAILESKKDDDISQQDYVDIVKRIEHHFLKGVKRNIRTRVLAEFTTNLKMAFLPDYSRTKRVGELYERELYSRIEDGEGKYGKPSWMPKLLASIIDLRRKPRWISELHIHPLKGLGEWEMDFYPKNHNWKRSNKVPILVINATSLNTGHVWQFTASYMGEPPNPINSKIDSNNRYRRMYYNDAPDPYKEFRLGYAVAASSGVPGLFDPLILNGLYPDKSSGSPDEVSVRLVDGGVYDNQGIASLLEQDCTVLLVSDASGHMESDSVPSGKALNVLWRSNEISMARVRGIQYDNVVTLKGSTWLRGLMFIHLKLGLANKAVAWRDCPDHLKFSEFEEQKQPEAGRFDYGIATDIQRQLAAVRTDLDSFSDAEAYALMASGYRMTGVQFEGEGKCLEGFTAQPRNDWRFLELEDSLNGQSNRKKHLEKLLGASSSMAFKIWKQWKPLVFLRWTILILAVAAVSFGLYNWRAAGIIPETSYEWIKKHLTFGDIGLTVLGFIGFFILMTVGSTLIGKIPIKILLSSIRWRDTVKKIAAGTAMCLFGWLIARIHLHVFDRLYLWYGSLDKFPK